MGLTLEQQKEYIEGQDRRAKKYLKPLTVLFAMARDEVTNDALQFFNSRRYRKAVDNVARAKLAKRDKGIKGISGKLTKLSFDASKIIARAQPKSYNEEIGVLVDLYNENTPEWIELEATPADKKKTEELLEQPYMGMFYKEYAEMNKNQAVRTWISKSRAVMSGRIQQVNKVEPSVQLTSDLRGVIDTLETRMKTQLMEWALTNTSRVAERDLAESVLKAEARIQAQLIKRAEKWA